MLLISFKTDYKLFFVGVAGWNSPPPPLQQTHSLPHFVNRVIQFVMQSFTLLVSKQFQSHFEICPPQSHWLKWSFSPIFSKWPVDMIDKPWSIAALKCWYKIWAQRMKVWIKFFSGTILLYSLKKINKSILQMPQNDTAGRFISSPAVITIAAARPWPFLFLLYF